MKTKITSMIVATTVVIVGYIISHPIVFQMCSNIYQFNDYTGCSDSSIKNIGFPLLIFSLWVLFVFVVAAFFSEKTFWSLIKFSAVAIPLAIIFIIITPVAGYRMGIDFFPFYRDDAARLAGGVFSAVSLVLIVWKYTTFRRTNT